VSKDSGRASVFIRQVLVKLKTGLATYYYQLVERRHARRKGGRKEGRKYLYAVAPAGGSPSNPSAVAVEGEERGGGSVR